MRTLKRHYQEVWAIDFEFTAAPGERPTPLCMIARELFSDRVERLWVGDSRPSSPPFSTNADALCVAYYASAELGCFLALDWPFPRRILDLYSEFRCLTNGLQVPCGYSLLGALAYCGFDGLTVAEKASMRQLAMRGGPYTDSERRALLTYCQTDVDALARLLPAMLPHIDFPRALLRGRYMCAAARIEWTGIPLDLEALTRIRSHWGRIKNRLIRGIDREYGVFLPTGQAAIDPQTRLGAALLDTAATWHVDPYQLAQAVDQVWDEENALYAQTIAARREARRASGLTAAHINRWEDAGRDSSSWPGLDDTAQELAGMLPDLGIGPGSSDVRYDETDYAGRLWELLRGHDERVRPKHDPSILRRAADLVASSLDDDWYADRSMSFSAQCFAAYLDRKGIPWPRLDSGALALDDETFRERARAYPADIGPLRELRHALSQLKLNDLAVGRDGRNRCVVGVWQSLGPQSAEQ